MKTNLLGNTKFQDDVLSLNFAIKEHFQFAANQYGGEKYMKKNLPILFSLFEETKKLHVPENEPNYKTLLQLSQIPDDFVDAVYIDHVLYDDVTKSVKVKATVSLTEQAYWIDTVINVETDAGEYINTSYNTAIDTTHQDIDYTIENVDMNLAKSKVFKVTSQSTWQNTDTKILKSQVITRTIYVNSIDVIHDITVTAPVYKNQVKHEENIIVVYGRASLVDEYVDYDYPVAGSPQHLYLDFSGNVVLKTGHTFDKFYPKDFRLILDCGAGCAAYFNKTDNRINPASNGFNWKLNNDWLTTVPTRRLPIHDKVALRFSFNFYCKGEVNPYEMYIASDLDDSLSNYSNYKKIPYLELLWGCVAKDSEVLMADGCLKKIQDVVIGEEVMNPYSKEAMPVLNVWLGNEEKLIHIQTSSDHTIKVSDTHPLITMRGVVLAKDINADDKMMMKDGICDSIKYIYTVRYDDKVYNLEFKKHADDKSATENTMLCNGFIVGDNYLQRISMSYSQKLKLNGISVTLKNELEMVNSLRVNRR